ncbi:MAG: pyridoxal-phosphate dependent enzyme [Spirochaetia bacterium]|nr:pyridoxal-phosphate dependent enzyme [Spirochaetia bacterium]
MNSPVHFLAHVSQALGVPVWIKREDLFVRHGIGGSKVRKLARILAQAHKSRATDLITCGTTGSHHVHAASVLGHAEGLDVHAVLMPQPDLPYSALIYRKTMSTNSKLTFVNGLANIPPALCRIHRKLKRQGRRPYLIFPGGSNPDGVAAYCDAARELISAGLPIDIQICVYGTGGITAGLTRAVQSFPALPSVHAVQIYPGFWNSKLYIRSMASFSRLAAKSIREEMESRPREIDRNIGKNKGIIKQKGDRLVIDSNFLGAGYGTENPDCSEAVALFKEDNIFLDPVYMARAGQALIRLSRSVQKPRGILLWYTAPGNL